MIDGAAAVLLADSIDWTNVIVSCVVGTPSIIAAIGVYLVHGKINTPSGKSIGRQVEDGLHVALANNMHLNAVTSKVDALVPAEAVVEESKVPGLIEVNGATETKGSE